MYHLGGRMHRSACWDTKCSEQFVARPLRCSARQARAPYYATSTSRSQCPRDATLAHRSPPPAEAHLTDFAVLHSVLTAHRYELTNGKRLLRLRGLLTEALLLVLSGESKGVGAHRHPTACCRKQRHQKLDADPQAAAIGAHKSRREEQRRWAR